MINGNKTKKKKKRRWTLSSIVNVEIVDLTLQTPLHDKWLPAYKYMTPDRG